MCDAPNLKKAVKSGEKTVRLIFGQVYTGLAWHNALEQERIFRLESERGIVAPESCKIIDSCTIELHFSQPLPQKCVVHGAAEQGIPCELPVDLATRNPMLSFYGVEVEDA